MELPKATIRLSKIARSLDVGITEIVRILKKDGHDIVSNPNQKIDFEMLNSLAFAYKDSTERFNELIELKNKILEKYPNKNIDIVKNIAELLENRMIGKIEKELGDKNARIKVFAILSESDKVIRLPENEIKALFPPNGYVFEPGFFYNFKHKLNDIISFRVEENSRASNGQDKFKLKYGTPDLKYFGVNAQKISNFKHNEHAINLESLIPHEAGDISNGFYGVTEKYVIGKIKIINGKIEPALHHRVKMWVLDENNLITLDDKIRLIKEPEGEFVILDCMSEKQLFEWFRKLLKQSQPDYVDLLDHNGSWRTELPQLFATTDLEQLEADKIRFKRIQVNFALLELSRNDINTFIETSENLKRTFIESIDRHKEEFKIEYEKQLEEFRIKTENQKKQLNDEICSLEETKKLNESTLTKIKSEIEVSQSKIEQLNQNKERILADFSIIKEVLGNEIKINSSIKTTELFVVENIEKPKNSTLYTSKDDFEKALQFQLNKLELFPKLAKRIINIMSVFDAIFISDIRIGIAMIEATSNATYIIQNVEPDWLHFSNLWENGLGSIWHSAYENPEKLHFLILEDINLSSPECYGRPLFDVILGVRKVIPFGKSPFPKNLRILATVASIENPEIGLPLNKITFNGWAAIGFKDDIYRKSEDVIEKTNGFVDTSSFLNFIPDEFEANEIKTVVQQEYSNLFDSE
jgi:hypothetical protein